MKLVVLLILFITLVYGEYVNPPTTFKSIKLTQSPSAGLKDTLLYLDSGILKKGSAPNGDTVTAGTGITVNHITGSFQVALYQPAITGSGVANYIAKWGSVSSLGYSSLIYDNGTNVGIGTTNPTHKLDVQGGYITALQSGGTAQAFMEGDVGISYFGNLDTGDIYLGNSNNWGYLVVKNGGNVGIGTTKPDSQLTTKGGIHDSGGLHVEGCSLLKDTVKIGDQSNYGITAYHSKLDLVDPHHAGNNGVIGFDYMYHVNDSNLLFGYNSGEEGFQGLQIDQNAATADINIPLIGSISHADTADSAKDSKYFAGQSYSTMFSGMQINRFTGTTHSDGGGTIYINIPSDFTPRIVSFSVLVKGDNYSVPPAETMSGYLYTCRFNSSDNRFEVTNDYSSSSHIRSKAITISTFAVTP